MLHVTSKLTATFLPMTITTTMTTTTMTTTTITTTVRQITTMIANKVEKKKVDRIDDANGDTNFNNSDKDDVNNIVVGNL